MQGRLSFLGAGNNVEKALKERDDEASKHDLTVLNEIRNEFMTWLADHHQEDPVLPVFKLKETLVSKGLDSYLFRIAGDKDHFDVWE